ncbi:hypothetical protein STAL104432_27845 [Streptomyces albus]
MTCNCSAAVSDGSRLGCWKTMPIRCRRSAAVSLRLIPVVRVPSTVTVPESGVMRVAATARRLDLPEPDGPTTAVTLPSGTVRLTRSRALSRVSPSG